MVTERSGDLFHKAGETDETSLPQSRLLPVEFYQIPTPYIPKIQVLQEILIILACHHIHELHFYHHHSCGASSFRSCLPFPNPPYCSPQQPATPLRLHI